VQAVLGNMFIPGWLDRYLARKAWEGQLDPEPLEPGRPDNLYSPLAADHGAHGRFDALAHGSALEARPARWKTAFALTVLAALAVGWRAGRR
jgi:hypothetical protein